jgi:hypothetical protein
VKVAAKAKAAAAAEARPVLAGVSPPKGRRAVSRLLEPELEEHGDRRGAGEPMSQSTPAGETPAERRRRAQSLEWQRQEQQEQAQREREQAREVERDERERERERKREEEQVDWQRVQCVKGVRRIAYYTPDDCSLGQFLVGQCFNLGLGCPGHSPSCNLRPYDEF